MVRTVRVVVVVVGAFLALGACSASKQVDAGMAPGGPSTTGAPTTAGAGSAGSDPAGDASRWGTCVTRLAYTKASTDASSPDRKVRRAALETLHAFPTPDGHETSWAGLLAYSDRYDELAAGVNLADENEFHKAMNQAMKTEPAYRTMADLDDDETLALLTLGADPPCDPTGLPADFGCADPETCTQEWAAAAHAHDQAALDRLAQNDLTGNTTPSASLTAVTCKKQESFMTCDGDGVPAPGSSVTKIKFKVSWARTADGRWYGVGAVASKFEAVASAIE